MITELSRSIASDVALLSGGAIAIHERTVSELECSTCQKREVVDGIVQYLVFEYDHRHQETK